MSNEILKTSLPPDQIAYTNDFFMGFAYVLETDGTTQREIDFTNKQPYSLEPFKYRKPVVIEGGDATNSADIQFVEDKNPREGMRPIALIKQAKRPPNHLHETDDAILCAWFNPETTKWETRYFPHNGLSETTWSHALDLLNQGSHHV